MTNTAPALHSEPPQPSSHQRPIKPTRNAASSLSGFHRLPMAHRRALIGQLANLSEDELRILSGEQGLCAEQADHMVENAVGVLSLPLGICVNLRLDGRDCLVPMAIEEPSVIAAANHAAKLMRVGGGLETTVGPAHMIGQIQVLDVAQPAAAEAAVLTASHELLGHANQSDPCLVEQGGGAVDIQIRQLPPSGKKDPVGHMVVVHLIVDVRDAMGANTVNTMCELIAPRIEQLTGGRVRLKIVSNLADRRTVTVTGRVPFTAFHGKGCGDPVSLARGIEEASVFAERDTYRAATHNKGIMNGVDAVLMAFSQDWRAVEAGAHAFAARSGHYSPLALWRVRDDSLHGEMELPLAVGIVGGITNVHPTCRITRRIAAVDSAAQLASMAAAVGLAQNLGALRALAAEGIQAGHMRVHARNVAVAAGAVGGEVNVVAHTIATAGPGSVSLASARQTLHQTRTVQTTRQDAAQVKSRFKQLRANYAEQIISLIDEILATATGDDSTLTRMCAYHLQTGGKRLRALLPLMVAESLGADPGRLIPFGAGCEMLHNATLVHDDLQDGDRLRRGKDTVWHRFGTAQAINLGDAMFYYTLLLIGRLPVPLALREATTRRVLEATLRVIDGQEREFLLKQKSQPDLREYLTMVQGKTSGLFALPMAGAAALCAASDKVIKALDWAARHLGVLFQIQDDVLDLFGNKGRDMCGSDILEGKRSILVVHALSHCSEAQADWLQRVLDKDRHQTTSSEVAEAIELLQQTGSLNFALQQIAAHRQRAIEATDAAEHPALSSLTEGMCDLFLEPIESIISQYGITQ